MLLESLISILDQGIDNLFINKFKIFKYIKHTLKTIYICNHLISTKRDLINFTKLKYCI